MLSGIKANKVEYLVATKCNDDMWNIQGILDEKHVETIVNASEMETMRPHLERNFCLFLTPEDFE